MSSPRKRARCADSDNEATPNNSLLTLPSAKRIKHADSDAVELMDVESPFTTLSLPPHKKSSISPKSPKEAHVTSLLRKAAQVVSKAGTLHTKKALSKGSEPATMTATSASTHEAYMPQVIPPSSKGLCEHSAKPVAPSVQEISASSTSTSNPNPGCISCIHKEKTFEEKIECELKEAKRNRAEGVEKLSPGCTVTANETNNVDNNNFVKEFTAVKKKLDAALPPIKRPSVYIVRPKARLVRRISQAHAASTSQVATASTQYATPPPSDFSSSPPRKDIAPNSPESNLTKESAAPKKVIYQSTGVQTLPPGDNNTFREIYGRNVRDRSDGWDPVGIFTCGEAGLSAMGRFGKDVGIHTYDLIYGRRFRAPVPISSVYFQDQGFQTMKILERENAIKKAKVKAAMQVMRLKPWMDKLHYKAFPEPKENMIVHSEQRQVWVEIDKKGQVEGTAPFPNVVCSETYSTGPPEPISVVQICGDDSKGPSNDDVVDFMEYPMPNWDTEEFVVEIVQALPLDRQMQTFKALMGGKASPTLASIETEKAHSRIDSEATRMTVEREQSFGSTARENTIDRDQMTTSTDKTKLVSSVSYTISNSAYVPKGSSEPHEDPLYLPEDSERRMPTVPPAHPPSQSSNKRGRYDEDEDQVDYSDSELIPSPKKQRLEDQEGNGSKFNKQDTNTNNRTGQAARDFESSARDLQQSIPYPPPPSLRHALVPGVSSQKSPLQQPPPKTSDASQQPSQQAVPQLQGPSQRSFSQQTSSPQTPSKQASSQQTPARQAPSHQTSSQQPALQDALPQQSILQPARRKREPRQGMNWALNLAGTGLLLNRKRK